jgi:hypothetical protein
VDTSSNAIYPNALMDRVSKNECLQFNVPRCQDLLHLRHFSLVFSTYGLSLLPEEVVPLELVLCSNRTARSSAQGHPQGIGGGRMI